MRTLEQMLPLVRFFFDYIHFNVLLILNLSSRRKNSASNATQNKNANPPKRRKQTQKKAGRPSAVINTDTITDGHMTAEEVERHLQSKQSLIGMVMAPATVPTEMFSNEPSLDSESNLAETSPSILGEDIGGIELGNTHE